MQSIIKRHLGLHFHQQYTASPPDLKFRNKTLMFDSLAWTEDS